MLALLLRIEAASDGQVKICRSVREIRHCMAHNVLAVVMHIEGAEALDTEGKLLDILYVSGLRSLGPLWSRTNQFGYGVPFRYPSSPDLVDSLTAAGKQLVRDCNRLRILVDLSHMDEKGFWQTASICDAPLVASHSNAHALSAQSRNLTNRQLAAIAETGGFVGVNHAGLAGYYQQIGDWRMFTRVTPNEDQGLPVVLVHGLVMSGRAIEPLALALSRDYHVLMPDLPGFGASALPASALVMSVDHLADALWLQHNGFQRAIWVGNSFGCQILVALAVKHPQAVAGLVLQGPMVNRHARSQPAAAVMAPTGAMAGSKRFVRRVRWPGSITPKRACGAPSTPCAPFRRAAIVAGEQVLVVGAGPIGLGVAAIAAASGAHEVVVADTSAFRRQHVSDQLGLAALNPAEADFYSALREQFHGRLALKVLDATGSLRQR